MNSTIQYPSDFPVATKAKRCDVVTLSKSGDWNTLNDVIICQDHTGNVTARFGDDKWNIRPYLPRASIDIEAFDFSRFLSSSTLTLELKLFVYGWLFHKSNKTNKVCKPTTLLTRFSTLKVTYSFLLEKNHPSLSALSDSYTWSEFEAYLIEHDFSQDRLKKIFCAINSALWLKPWLQVEFGIERAVSIALARKLSDRTTQQTLTIPERIADEIYGKAIELVEEAHPHREAITLTEQSLQKNYLEGKQILDNKIKAGRVSWLTDDDGNITNTHRYSQEITCHQPIQNKKLIEWFLGDIQEFSNISNSMDFRRYLGQLITACYICCGAFSGMRDSELSELTPHSYYSENFDGRYFHMLQSRTFKLGEKKDTWVVAPIAQKAIELVEILTRTWRKALTKERREYQNTLWVNNVLRSKPPVVITDWNERLRRFCQQFNIVVTQEDYQECVESNPNSPLKIANDVIIDKPWKLASHQFRRTLAFYTIKHNLGTAVSLKQQFKHLYLQMTEWYTEGGTLTRQKALQVDSQLQQILDNAKDEYTANKFFNMIYSDKPLSGTHGKSIVAMRENPPHIYSSWDVIYQAVKNKTLTLHGTLHSYCKNGYNCDMDGVVNPAFCVDCNSGSSIIDDDNAKWWEQKHIALTAYLANNNYVSPSIYSHCITQIRAAEIVMKDFGIEHTTYQHPVEVVEL